MKELEKFILEKLKINKPKTKYAPKDKQELIDIIIADIEANDPNCSLNTIDVSNITDMSYLFRGGDKDKYYGGHPILAKFNGDISLWDVSNVTNMQGMFERCKYSGKNGDISSWDVSNVTNLSEMFFESKFNGDIADWNVSNITDMHSMFAFSKFTGDISNWNVSGVTNMNSAFYGSIFNGDISNWDVSNVMHMTNIFSRSPLEKHPPKWYKY